MPRGRASLTDKQERILVQCQLMGLTTSDMIKISNRLKALDIERENRKKVDEAVSGMTWKIVSTKNFVVTDSKGLVYDCADITNIRKIGYYHKSFGVTITHPGTRMKPRKGELTIHENDYILARHCPENSKTLYRICEGIKQGRVREKT